MKKENGNRQLWRKLGLAAASAVLALGASEVVVRLFVAVPAVSSLQVGSQQSAYVRSSNPVLGYELKASHRDPEAAIRFKNGYGHWRDHTRFPYTNAHGQRDLERSFEKPEGVKRILVLGDSVVAGHGILDLNDTISRQLEQAIDAKHEVEVLNFGVGGYCTRGEVELLREKGLKYSPDLVVVVFVENDFQDFNTQFRDDRGYRVERPAILNSLFKSSSLFRKASLAFNLSRFREEFDPQYSMDLNQLAVGENNVVEGFRLLDTLREQHDFAVAIAIWPHFGKSRIIDRPTLSSHMLS